jgi:hypothetical protein
MDESSRGRSLVEALPALNRLKILRAFAANRVARFAQSLPMLAQLVSFSADL